jgi:hypothetical protein
MSGIKEFYINTYKDQFMINPPPFFELFLWSEILFQIPVMIWGIPALYRSVSHLSSLDVDIQRLFSVLCANGQGIFMLTI